MLRSKVNNHLIKRYITINSLKLAGHSKWANIRHIKAFKDGQKSLQFIKLSRQIRLAIQDGKSVNPILNPKLQTAIDDALKKKMPNQTIQQILKSKMNLKIQKFLLEIIFLKKIAIICVIYTDNVNKIKIDIGALLKKSGASLTEVRHLFDDTGLLECIGNDLNGLTDNMFEDTTTEHAILCGAETIDIIDTEKCLISITCDPLHIDSVKKCLEHRNYSIELAEHVFIPKHPIKLNPIEHELYTNFANKLKSYEGIEEIYDNID